MTQHYCNECWRYYDAVRDAQNRRAFVEQQVHDNGACMIEKYKQAVMGVTAAIAEFEAHKLNCAMYREDRR